MNLLDGNDGANIKVTGNFKGYFQCFVFLLPYGHIKMQFREPLPLAYYAVSCLKHHVFLFNWRWLRKQNALEVESSILMNETLKAIFHQPLKLLK